MSSSSKSNPFRPSAVGASMSGSSRDEGGLRMDPELANRLFECGASLVLLDFPVGTEFGIDMNVWNTGERFKGVKMIPPGVHFVYYSAVSKEGQAAPRTGFFHDFTSGEVLAKRYNPREEDIEDISDEDRQGIRAGLKSLDRNLGAYPYDSWKKWISLTNRISSATISRLEPMSGKIQSVTELIPQKHFTSKKSTQESIEGRTDMEEGSSAQDIPPPAAATSGKRKSEAQLEEDKLPKMLHKPGTEIRYTPLPTERYPKGATPSEITHHSMDSSFQLEAFLNNFYRMYGDPVSSSMAHLNQTDEVLAEIQFCFICFLVGQHYDSFEHWKGLVSLLCSCDEAMLKLTDLYLIFLSDLHFQIKEVPDDFFVDIVSRDNFLRSKLAQLFATIKSNDKIDKKLKDRAMKMKINLSKKFAWDFDMDLDDEDAPVVVEMEEPEAVVQDS